MLNAYGYKIITLLPEKAPTYNLSRFDYLITTNKVLTSTVLLTDTKNTEIKYLIDKYGRAYYPKYQPFSCVYEDVDKEFHYKDRDNIIMDSRCFIDDPFFEKRNFVLIKAFDFQSEMREYTRYVSVYKNKKKS